MCGNLCCKYQNRNGDCRFTDRFPSDAACAEGYVDEDELYEPDPEDLIPPERIVDWPI